MSGQREDGDLTEFGPDGAPGQPAAIVDVDVDRAERPAAPALRGQDEIDAVRADREVVEPDPVTEGDAGVQAGGFTVVGERDPHRHLLAFEAPPRPYLGLGRHPFRARPTRQGEGEQHQGAAARASTQGRPVTSAAASATTANVPSRRARSPARQPGGGGGGVGRSRRDGRPGPVEQRRPLCGPARAPS
ncbi:hypothetical protein ACFQ51_42615 [Streptomyces kaempferi]